MSIQISKSKALQAFQVFRQGCVILISIFLAKSSLTTAQIGNYELLLFLGGSFTYFWVNGLIQGMLSEFPSLPEADKRPFLFQVYLLFCLLSILVFSILFIGKGFLIPLLAGQEELQFFHLFLLFLLLNIPTFLVEYYYLLHDKGNAIMGWGIAIFSMQFLVFTFPIFLGFDLVYSFWGLIALAGLKHLWALIVVSGYGQINFEFSKLKNYLHLSLPLIAYALIAGFALLFDNWLVGWYYKSDALFAVFKYGARELPLATALAAALSASMIPELVAKSNASLKSLKEKSTKLMHILFPISIVLLVLSQYLYPLVFSEAFSESAAVFDVYLLVIISRLLFPHSVLIALKKTSLLWYTSLVELAINVILSFLFVKLWGMPGIALATAIAFLFEKVFYVIYLKRKEDISFGAYTNTTVFYGYSLVLIGAYVLKQLMMW